jgi:hypothetical protein
MPLIGVNSVAVRPDRVRAFEEGIARLAKRATERKEPWQWTAHQTQIGAVGTFHFVYQADDFASVGKLGTIDGLYRRVLGDAEGEALFGRVNECIQSIEHNLSIDRPDLSYAPEPAAPGRFPIAVTTVVRARPGRIEACEELIRKLAEAIPKAEDTTRLVAHQTVIGDLRVLWTVRPMRDLADFDRQLPGPELLNRAFGPAEGGLIWRAGVEAMEESRRSVVALRPDLSNLPH